MRIEKWTGPPADTHTYLLADEVSGEAWAIDAPQRTAEQVFKFVRNGGLQLTRVVLTHAHFDHILDAGRYQAAGIPIALHPADELLLSAPQTTMFGLSDPMPSIRIDEPLSEGQTLRLGETEWQVWHVPGHAPGHTILYCAALDTVMGGDLLFRGGYGRVDFPLCDPQDMAESLLRILELPDQTRVYPGHGPETTIGAERPWLDELLSNPTGVSL